MQESLKIKLKDDALPLNIRIFLDNNNSYLLFKGSYINIPKQDFEKIKESDLKYIDVFGETPKSESTTEEKVKDKNVPSDSWSKIEIIAYMQENNIKHNPTNSKAALLKIIGV